MFPPGMGGGGGQAYMGYIGMYQLKGIVFNQFTLG